MKKSFVLLVLAILLSVVMYGQAGNVLSVTLKMSEQGKVGFNPVAADGTAGTMDSPLTKASFTSSNEAVITIEQALNGTIYLYPRAAGTSRVKVQAFSQGVDVSEYIDVKVVDSKVVSLGLTVTPVSK